MTGLLKGVTILITRPKNQTFSISREIENLGGRVIIFPCIEIVFEKDQAILEKNKKVNSNTIVIFLSANAVNDATLNWGEHPRTIIAIGPGTAKKLKALGKTAVVPPQYNSAGILTLPILKSVFHQTIMIYCGKDPKPLLAESLKKRGAYVDEINCYRRMLPHYLEQEVEKLIANSVDGIVSTSLTNLKNLYKILQSKLSWLLEKPIIVINQEMITLAKTMGFQQIFLAEKPDDQSILKEVINEFSC